MIRKVILIIVLLIVAILVYYYVTDWRYRKFDPQINPHPKYFMTIKGKVAPSLAGKVPVKFHIQYYTRNEACYETVNDLEGVTAPRTRDFVFSGNTKDKPGDFTIKIPLDKYITGRCKWLPAGMDLGLRSKSEGNTLVFFTERPISSNVLGKVLILCAGKSQECRWQFKKKFNTSNKLPVKSYFLNVELGG